MLSKFHKNAIITGYVDFYCLVCECHMKNKDDIKIHIAKPVHIKNLESTNFLDKYKEECIRKVKKGYYCEYCNLLLSSISKVGLHVVEVEHLNNKGIRLLKRVGNSIVIFHDVLISENAWNGLVSHTCAICHKEFENEELHKNEASHKINLVQTRVHFGNNNSAYRMIADSFFQCLTCNLVLGSDVIKSHFEELFHKELYFECHKMFVYLNEKSQKTKVQTDLQEEPTEKIASKCPESTSTINIPEVSFPKLEKQEPCVTKIPQKSNVKTPEDSQIHILKNLTGAPEKETDTSKPKDLQNAKTPEIAIHIVTKKPIPSFEVPHRRNTQTETKKPYTLEKGTYAFDDQVCRDLGAEDYITINNVGGKWCLVCDWSMHNDLLQEHLQDEHHKVILKAHKQRLRNIEKNRLRERVATPLSNKVVNDEEFSDDDNRSKILDSLTEFQKNGININFITNKVICKKCSKCIDFDFNSIENHIEEHETVPANKESAKCAVLETTVTPTISNDNKKVDDSKKTQQNKRNDEEKISRGSSVTSNRDHGGEIEKFAKKHNLSYNKGADKLFCRACDTRIWASMKNMKEHVGGQSHKNKIAKVENKGVKTVVAKKQMKDFIKQLVLVEYTESLKDVVINESICINIHSFMMITCITKLRCEACEVDLVSDQLEDHKMTSRHKQAMTETVVIESMESEFIREVHPGLLHCGFCNIVANDDEELASHLGSTAHRESKTAANWRLQQYLSEIVKQNQAEEMLYRMLFTKLN